MSDDNSIELYSQLKGYVLTNEEITNIGINDLKSLK